MAKTLEELKLADLLPSSIASDKNVSAAAKALDGPLQTTTASTNDLPFLSAIDSLPESWLDALAWQWHVDTYSLATTLSEKRSMVQSAILNHMRLGTPYAVEKACADASVPVTVVEYWEYDGTPYHFRLQLRENQTPPQSTLNKVLAAVMRTKNLRSWFDGFQYQVALSGSQYVAGALRIGKVTAIEGYAGVNLNIPAAVQYTIGAVRVAKMQTVSS